jgi:hypothetical protein
VPTRTIEVDPGRLERWLTGFGDRHGAVAVAYEDTPGGRVVRAQAADGAHVVGEPFAFDPLGVVLVRRGGYAVAVVRGGALETHKVGTRRVQSRTAAGGWSQQRFARRRANQADELVGAVVAHARRILLRDDESPPQGADWLPRALVVGGDRALVGAVLDSPALRRVADLPRRELWDLPDPRREVLDRAVRRGRAYRLALTEPVS